MSENGPLTEREETRLKAGWEAIAGGEDGTVSPDDLREALNKAGFDPDSEVVDVSSGLGVPVPVCTW